MFDGLNEETFAAYTQEKWASNVHNLARMQVKSELELLAGLVAEDIGGDLSVLERSASDEIPNITNQKKVDAQWLYWFRNAQERQELKSLLKENTLSSPSFFNIAAQDKHAIIAFVLRHDGLWMGLRLASAAMVDRKNLSAKLDKTWEREGFLTLLKNVSDHFEVGFGNEVVALSDMDAEHIEAMVGQLLASKESWHIGQRLSKDDVIAMGESLLNPLAEVFKQLIPFYKYCSWSKENDFIGAQKHIQEEKAEKRRQAGSYAVGNKVRITSGLFSGKQGLVESIDTKSNVRVKVGNMSVVVPSSELIPVKG